MSRLRFVRIGTDHTKKGLRGVYSSDDGRFVIRWIDRQGARSTWTVHDTSTDRVLRADSLVEARETARELAGEDIE